MRRTGPAPDLDRQFPALSRQATFQGLSLVERAKRATPAEHRYLDLNGCCRLALAGPAGLGVGPHGYLATLDEFFERYAAHAAACHSAWDRLNGRAKSSFLDTIVEAVWALHFLDRGFRPQLEQPFDLSDPHPKNADLVVAFERRRFWLDAYSVDFTNTTSMPKPRRGFGTALPTRDQATAGLSKRARQKYADKFAHAVSSGVLKDDPVGVLLSILKADWCWPAFLESFGQPLYQPPVPTWFPTKTPQLSVVLVHTLVRRPSAPGLRPATIFQWLCPPGDSFAAHALPPVEVPQLIRQ